MKELDDFFNSWLLCIAIMGMFPPAHTQTTNTLNYLKTNMFFYQMRMNVTIQYQNQYKYQNEN